MSFFDVSASKSTLKSQVWYARPAGKKTTTAKSLIIKVLRVKVSHKRIKRDLQILRSYLSHMLPLLLLPMFLCMCDLDEAT